MRVMFDKTDLKDDLAKAKKLEDLELEDLIQPTGHAWKHYASFIGYHDEDSERVKVFKELYLNQGPYLYKYYTSYTPTCELPKG